MSKSPRNAAAAPSLPGGARSSKGMFRFVLELVRPYRKWLIVVFIAMLIETAMSIAAPWPLKIIIDNVVGKHKLPEFLTWLRDFSSGEHTLALAGVAALGVIAHRGDRRGRGLHRQLLHRERRAVCRERSSPAALSSSPAALAEVLRHPPDRQHGEHDHLRREHDPELRLDRAAQHPRRWADHHRHARGDALPQLRLRAHRRGRHAGASVFHLALQEGGEEGHARGAQTPERDRRRGRAGPAIGALGQGLRAAGYGRRAAQGSGPGRPCRRRSRRGG